MTSEGGWNRREAEERVKKEIRKLIEKYKREYAKRAKIVKQYIRSGKHIDRYRLINKPMASIVEEETIFKEKEEKNTGGENVSDGGDQDSSSKEDIR